jgi:dipeptidyl aminopeptidase/acylaminoacyl peptidase
MHSLRILFVAFVVTLIVGIALPTLAGDKRPFSVEDLYRIGRVSQLVVSPGGEYAAFVVKKFDMDANKGQASIWLASLKEGTSRQLTFSDKSDWAPRWISETRLAFLSSRSGASQIWAIDINGGEAERLTDFGIPVGNFIIASDGKHVALQADVFPDCQTALVLQKNKQNSQQSLTSCNKEKAAAKEKDKVSARVYDKLLYRIWDTWRTEARGHVLWATLDGGGLRDLTPGDWQTPPLDLGGYSDLSISPDNKEVAFTSNATENPAWNTNNDIFIVSVDGGKPTNITENNEAVDAEPVYSPDGKYIAYVSMKRAGFEADRRVLTLFNRSSRKTEKISLLTDALDRSVSQFSWAPDSRSIVFTASDRGRKIINRVSVPSGRITKLIDKHINSYPQFDADGDRILFLRQSMSMPTEVFFADSTGSNVQRISRVNDEVLADVEMGQYEDIEYSGADGDKVHGFLLKPPGFNPKKKYPLLMLIHGGPQGAFGDGFHPRWNMQMFATPGFVVAAVNFHGSKGYGQEFCDAVSGDWGGKPYEDIMKGVDYITEEFSFIDGKNVSAAGASYGGFMINWILGHTDRFRSLVSHDGVYEQFSMYGATEELWFPEWEFKGTPWENPELYAKFSPASYAENFKTPTLIIHGEHDYRVPYTQGLQLFTALQRQGVESRLLLFPDENHFVQKPQNARFWWHSVLGWLADHAKIKWTPPGVIVKKKNPGKNVKKIAG